MSTAPPTLPEVSTYARRTRYFLFAVAALLVVGGVLWTVGSVFAIGDRGIHIGKDRLDNEVESRVVEVLLDGGEEGTITCTGSFVRATGEILVATHCLTSIGSVCEFNTTLPGYPFDPTFSYYVEVMNVNGTGGQKWTGGEKYIFSFEIVAFSGITDVSIIKPLPFTRSDGSVIEVADQDYFEFDNSDELARGDKLEGLGYDVAFLKKLAHQGSVMAAGKDRGTSFAVSVEQVFVDVGIQPGASGMGMFSPTHKLMVAPISYRWDYTSTEEEGRDYKAQIAASGTSTRVSAPLTSRMLNVATPANGVEGRYLVPGLGIIPTEVVSGVNVLTNWGTDYIPYLQDRGIIFAYLASQTYYEYLTNHTYGCGLPPYTVTPPSMLGAPLDHTESGTPPDPFIDYPGGDPSMTFTMVILEAIEGHLYHHDWHYLGEDAGLTTVSGVLFGTGKWVGDQVRVRIRAVNPYYPSDPTKNWEGIYLVTLNAIDPFWDNLVIDTLGSYVSYLRVNESGVSGRPDLYLDPVVTLPVHARGHRPARGQKKFRSDSRRRAAPPRGARNTVGGSLISPIPEGVNIYALPTLAEHYNQFALARGITGRSAPPHRRGQRAPQHVSPQSPQQHRRHPQGKPKNVHRD